MKYLLTIFVATVFIGFSAEPPNVTNKAAKELLKHPEFKKALEAVPEFTKAILAELDKQSTVEMKPNRFSSKPMTLKELQEENMRLKAEMKNEVEVQRLKKENEELKARLEILRGGGDHRVDGDQKVKLVQLGGTSLSSPPESLIINVTKEGVYKVQIGQSTIETDAFIRLKEVLKQNHETKPGLQVVIRGDEKASFGQGSAALAACVQAGFKSADIAWDTTATK